MEKAAFFDVDDTLIKGNISKIYAKVYYDSGMIRLADLLRISYLSFLHHINLLTYERLAKGMLSFLDGCDEAEERKRVRENAGNVFSKLKKKMAEEVEMRRKEGFRIVLLTTAIQHIVMPLASYLRADDILSSRLVVRKGKLTGEMEEVCYGERKRDMMLGYCRKKRISPRSCWFYTDSYADLPALLEVGTPVAVDPDRKLSAYAKKVGWKQIKTIE